MRRLLCMLALGAPWTPALGEEDGRAEISIDIRDPSGTPLTGYIMFRPKPPGLRTFETPDAAARDYYAYFRNLGTPGPATTPNFLLRGEEAPLLPDGTLRIKQSDVRMAVTGRAWPAGELLYAFFFWSSNPSVALTNDGELAERIGRTDRVAWWTIHLDGKEGADGRVAAQRVTILNNDRWTERWNFSDAPNVRLDGGGYFPAKQEKQCFVLEPPEGYLDMAGQPALLVHGMNGAASEWRMDSNTSIPLWLRQEKGYAAWELHYSLGQEDLADSAQMLYFAVQGVHAAYQGARPVVLDLVTHGYGGVVLRKSLQANADLAGRLGRILMIGPPHHGSHAASLIRGYLSTPWAQLRERLGWITDDFKDPTAPIYRELTPGSQALQELERGPEAFAEFKNWRPDKAALVLAGGVSMDAADAADPDEQEAPFHSDGAVSMSSASLLDQGVPFATIALNHKEQLSSPDSAAAIAAFLNFPDSIRSAPGVDFGEIVSSANCGWSARGGLTVDTTNYPLCGAEGVGEVKLLRGSASGLYAETLQPAGPSSFHYYSRVLENQAGPRGAARAIAGLAMSIGETKDATVEAGLRISCNSGGAFLEPPVTLLSCRTATLFPSGGQARRAFQLILSKTGSGSVISAPAGIDCGAGCTSASHEFPSGAVVLTALPSSSFLGWEGACTGAASTCTVILDASKNVTAKFGAPVTLAGLGLTATTILSGGTVAATVSISAAAPSGGRAVTLESSNAAVVTVPASVTVPAGQTAATFAVTAKTVTSSQQVTIKATLDSDAKTVTVTVVPPTSAGGTTTGPYNLQFVSIPAGEFTMGCSTGDSECFSYESPRHLVRLTKPFEIGRYEVTQAQWEAVMGSNPSYFKGADLPVETLSWNDVQQFILRLNARNDGYAYRLPTEAEWEYAARAGTSDKYAGGALDEIAWYHGNASRKTHPVGQKKPNAWGLHDMLGNVVEWVLDSQDSYPSAPVSDPVVLYSIPWKWLRGGSWQNSALAVRVSFRLGYTVDGRILADCGFRCVRRSLDAASTVTLSAVSLSADSVVSAKSVTGTVTLTSTAPSGGTAVALFSSNTAAATVPGSLTVPGGQTAANFTVTAKTVTSNQRVIITAGLGSDIKTATLTVLPPPSAGGTVTGPFNIQFISIPAGEFTMGCSPGDGQCISESPHVVRLTKGFEIGKYEVTQDQWRAVMGGSPSLFRGGDLPVEQVNWNDVQQFLQELNARNDGYRYRLPTEAEWEYAARAGTTDKFAGGAVDDVAWHPGNSGGGTHPVGQKKPNAWGLHDMLGNVHEWVQDWYESYPRGVVPVIDPTGPEYGTQRLVRGGCWFYFQSLVRVSSRLNVSPGWRGDTFGSVGFRCVRDK